MDMKISLQHAKPNSIGNNYIKQIKQPNTNRTAVHLDINVQTLKFLQYPICGL